MQYKSDGCCDKVVSRDRCARNLIIGAEWPSAEGHPKGRMEWRKWDCLSRHMLSMPWEQHRARCVGLTSSEPGAPIQAAAAAAVLRQAGCQAAAAVPAAAAIAVAAAAACLAPLAAAWLPSAAGGPAVAAAAAVGSRPAAAAASWAHAAAGTRMMVPCHPAAHAVDTNDQQQPRLPMHWHCCCKSSYAQ